MTFNKKLQIILSVLMCCQMLRSTRSQSQTPDDVHVSTTQAQSVPTLSDRARRQLQEKLETASPTPLQIVDVDGAPLEISSPKATSLKIEGNCDAPPDPPLANDYVMKLRFRLVNRSNQRVTGAGLEVTNSQAHNTFYMYPSPIDLEPGKSKRFDIAFMLVTGDPTYLSLKMAGARFGDQSVWEGFPFPKLKPVKEAPIQLINRDNSLGPVIGATQVDSKPRLMNSAQPRYTEEARRNHVLGAVSARLLVGPDGAVKGVNIMNALPDGLTEQAIRAAYELRFEPARKNGEPVEWWTPVMIEFNLK